ncbi:Aldehyde/histidinol dehydrogenase [Xylogone sp. PMI_703]|nr:Aldehyde/histidinol dehydrogenase [Xylogone sp. PMI_703]
MTANTTSATKASSQVPLIIDGKQVTTDASFDVHNPSTGKVLWRSSTASPHDAVAAVESAQSAFPGWSKTKPAYRRDLFLRAANIFEQRGEELARFMKEETGAEDRFIDFNLVSCVEMLRDLAGRISSIAGSVPTLSQDGSSGIIYMEPYGVVLGIAPWNSPFPLGVRAFAFALAAGNTVVLKGSEFSPQTYFEIVNVFKEAGLPDGCLNLILHDPKSAAEVTTALVAHPLIKKINFTGSTRVGRIIASLAGEHLKPVLMELGGKASVIIMADANLEKAALQCTLGAFMHGGQICMSTERIVVHRDVAEAFVTEFKKTVNQIYGPSGPAPILVSSIGASKTKKLISDAVRKGATVILGDIEAKESLDTYMRPTILSGIKKDMDLYYEESFGPTVSVFVVDSEDEALELANDTEYGLVGAVFTENLATGLRIAQKYETGAVHINSMTVHDEPVLPHGGVKQSGFGRFNAMAGLQEFLRSKTVTWKD